MRPLHHLLPALVAALLLGACGDGDPPGTPMPDEEAARAAETATGEALVTAETLAADMDAFRKRLGESFQRQLELIRAGDAEGLRPYFTARQQARITPELLAKVKGDLDDVVVADLIRTVDIQGKGTGISAKITMKNGRTLTTVVYDAEANRWLADTIWFR